MLPHVFTSFQEIDFTTRPGETLKARFLDRVDPWSLSGFSRVFSPEAGCKALGLRPEQVLGVLEHSRFGCWVVFSAPNGRHVMAPVTRDALVAASE